MKRLVIIGAGGHGKVVADAAEATQQYQQIVFIDKDESQKNVEGVWHVIDHSDDFVKHSDGETDFFVAIGNNQIRRKVIGQLVDIGLPLATIVHPSAVVSPYSQVGEGTLICANVVINSFTQVGIGCILNTSCSVDHDNLIENFVHIAPGCRLAGTIRVGECAFLGIGTSVIPNTEIGENAQTGAGSVVVNNIKSDALAVGVPAKEIK